MTDYAYPSLKNADKSSGPDDPMAAALAVLNVRKQGVEKFLGASLAFASAQEHVHYKNVINQGIDELEALLKRDKLL